MKASRQHLCLPLERIVHVSQVVYLPISLKKAVARPLLGKNILPDYHVYPSGKENVWKGQVRYNKLEMHSRF